MLTLSATPKRMKPIAKEGKKVLSTIRTYTLLICLGVSRFKKHRGKHKSDVTNNLATGFQRVSLVS